MVVDEGDKLIFVCIVVVSVFEHIREVRHGLREIAEGLVYRVVKFKVQIGNARPVRETGVLTVFAVRPAYEELAKVGNRHILGVNSILCIFYKGRVHMERSIVADAADAFLCPEDERIFHIFCYGSIFLGIVSEIGQLLEAVAKGGVVRATVAEVVEPTVRVIVGVGHEVFCCAVVVVVNRLTGGVKDKLAGSVPVGLVYLAVVAAVAGVVGHKIYD